MLEQRSGQFQLNSTGSVTTQPKVAQIRVHNKSPTRHPNPNHHPNHNPTTKQHAIVNIQLNIVACPTSPDKFI